MNIMAKQQSKKSDSTKISLMEFVGRCSNNKGDKWVINKFFHNDKELRSVSEWKKLINKHLTGLEIKLNT